MADLVEQPPEDAFVRTAIRGMQTPEHDPDFWDRLAGGLDDLEAQFGRSGFSGFDGIGKPGSLEEGLPRHPVSDRRARLSAERSGDQVHVDAVTASVPAAVAASAASLDPSTSVFASGAAAAFTGATRGAATRGAATRGTGRAASGGRIAVRQVADPLARLTIEHDAAALPSAMRRASNVVLIAVALVALLVAMFAGLSLVRQRSESGSPAPVEQPAPAGAGDEVGMAPLEDLAA